MTMDEKKAYLRGLAHGMALSTLAMILAALASRLTS
jgi:hypothetical protein